MAFLLEGPMNGMISVQCLHIRCLIFNGFWAFSGQKGVSIVGI
jgi:hypothetical protein